MQISKKYIIGTSRNGRQCQRKSTAGWKLLCRVNDGSKIWYQLTDLKESCPVQVAEFVVAQNLVAEPDFAWWVPYTMKKHNVIISAIKS